MKKIGWFVLVFFCIASLGSLAFAAEPQFKWRMQVIHAPAHTDFQQNVATSEKIAKATNGRLQIEVVPNGTIVPSLEGFQACGEGVFEMHNSWPMYARGVEYSLFPQDTGNLLMDVHDRYVWIYEFGGWELIQKALDKLNLQLIAVEVWGTEIMMSRLPFKSIADMKGKKMRTSDPRLLAKNGVAGLTLPLEEVFTGFATGTVDSAEFGHLKYNEGLGLTDVAKYGIFPDFWNVHNVTTVVANKDAYKKLPEDVKLILQMGFRADEFTHWTKSQWTSAIAYHEMKNNGTLEFMRMDAKQWPELRRQTYEIEKEDVEKYKGITKETYESMWEFMALWYPYKTIAAWWGEGLAPEEQMGFDPNTIKRTIDVSGKKK